MIKELLHTSLIAVALTTCASVATWAKASTESGESISVEMPLPPIYIEKEVTLKKRETLSQSLMKSGLPRKMVAKAMHPLQRKYNVKRMQPGQKVSITYKEGLKGQVEQLEEISFFTRNDKIVATEWNDKKKRYVAKIDKRPTEVRTLAATGTIEGSLYMSAKKAKLPTALVAPFANLFAWDIDFTRDIRPGDGFKVLYQAIYDDKGNFLRSGRIVAAELQTRKKKYDSFRIVQNGIAGYYNSKGYNKRKVLLRTPIEFARISSHFNLRRKHPILGYTRAHKGTDFAAPSGTPIKASGDGVVERASWYGGYGRFIRIRHGNGFKTHYAHLSRYGRGIKKGKRVRQGQVIGYVGTSGRSTGPHLHYEVLKRGKHVNPMRIALPVGVKLPKSKRPQLRKLVAGARQQWAEAGTMVAEK